MSDAAIQAVLLSEEMVTMLARRRAGGWMPADLRSRYGAEILREARADLQAIVRTLHTLQQGEHDG